MNFRPQPERKNVAAYAAGVLSYNSVSDRMRYKVPILGDFLHYFRITRACFGFEFAFFILLNLVSATIESFGILLFIPFLAQLNGASSADRVPRWLSSVLAFWGIPATLGYILLLIVIGFLLKGAAVFSLIAYRQRLVNRTKWKLRDQIIKGYSEVDYRYVMDKNEGFLGNLVVSEIERAIAAIEAFCQILSSLIVVSIFFTIALFLYSFLSGFMLLAVGVSLLLLRRLSSKARQYSFQITGLSARLNEFLIQMLQAFKYLKATARFSTVRSRLLKVSSETTHTQNKVVLVNAAVLAVQEPLLVICLAAVFYYGVVIGQRDMASVMVSALFFYRCMIEMGHFHRHWHWLSSNAGAMEVVWRTTKELDEHREKKAGEAVPAFTEKIELRDVSYAYDSQTVLRDVSICIARNTAVALVGPSGMGKTTLVDLLTGVLKPTKGVVCLDSRDLHSLSLSRYRESIGYVEQDTIVFDDTIANNISMQWESSEDPAILARIQQAARNGNCEEFIERMPSGYNTRVGSRGVKLSGGQRQRLAIARELFKQPDILILDEATSSLDSQSESNIQESIERLRGTLTLIIISHRLSTIKNVDYIYVIDQGRIIEQGTFSELSSLQGSVFRRMCEVQRVVAS